MYYKIISVEREFGSGASFIAKTLAERLGWELLDQSLTEKIAKLAQVDPKEVLRCDEHNDPVLYRLAKVFARGSYERIMPIEGQESFDTDRMVQLVTGVIEKAGEKGNCVIVGRGAPWILRNRKDAFHVFIYAPREEKIKRVLAQGYTEEEAAELVDTVDQERAAFIKRYFGKDWPTRYLYNMMINSSMGEELVVDTILHTMHASAVSAPSTAKT
jgi:cytidylate kinase